MREVLTRDVGEDGDQVVACGDKGSRPKREVRERQGERWRKGSAESHSAAVAYGRGGEPKKRGAELSDAASRPEPVPDEFCARIERTCHESERKRERAECEWESGSED